MKTFNKIMATVLVAVSTGSTAILMAGNAGSTESGSTASGSTTRRATKSAAMRKVDREALATARVAKPVEPLYKEQVGLLVLIDTRTEEKRRRDETEYKVFKRHVLYHPAGLCPEINTAGDRIIDKPTNHWNIANLWDRDGRCLAKLKHEDHISSAKFNSAGTHIVTASHDCTAKVWDLDGNCLTTLRGHTCDLTSARFNAAGDLIVTASLDGTAKVWDLYGNCLTTLRHGDRVMSASFSTVDNHIVTASNDHTAKVWDLHGRCLLATLIGHKSGVISAEFNAIGDRIVTVSLDHTAKIWDLHGRCLATHVGVISAEFNAIGDRIVTASIDHKARVWDLKCNCLATLGHDYKLLNIRTAKFNTAGDRIITVSLDGIIEWEDTRITQLQNQILQLLLAQHDRCGANSPAHMLTQNLVRYIYELYGVRPFDPVEV